MPPARGTTFGAPTELEVELAELVCEAVPSIDVVRMTNSGTEATMSAVRLARGFTGRDRILKFDGNYHGHGDALLVSAGSGVATLGLPDSPGVTQGRGAGHRRPAVQRPRGRAGPLRKGGRVVRRRDPRAGRRQHGLRAAGRGVPRGAARHHRRVRRVAHLRRGHDGVPAGPRRGAGALRRDARPHVPRQDHRRRFAGRGLRRAARDHGPGRAQRARLPGRHPLGQPAGDGRGPRHPSPQRRAGLLRAPGRPGRALASGHGGGRLGGRPPPSR